MVATLFTSNGSKAPVLDAYLDEVRVYARGFTIKQKDSGICLSLSRQIICLHLKEYGGDLLYIQYEQGACFRCVFG